MKNVLRDQSAAERNALLRALAAGAALLCAAMGFVGWVLHEPALKGLGGEMSIWPLTAVGFSFLAMAQLAQLRGYSTAALALCAITLTIGILGVAQGLPRDQSGIHSLLFGEELARLRAEIPSRAPYMVLFDWALMIAAMLLAGRQTWRSCLAASILANIPLALSIATIVITIADLRISGEPAYYLWASLPASLATVSLCVAIFLSCRARDGTATGEDAAGWTIVRVFPFVLLIPGLTWLLEAVVFSRRTSVGWLDATAVGLNMLLIVAIIGWAMYRLSRQQGALVDFTNALDTTQVALIRPDSTVVQWSRGCEQLFGWTAAEAAGACKYALLQTEFDGEQSDLASLPPDGELKREVTHKTRDGRALRVLEHVRRIDTGKRKPVLVVALTDVTERKMREAHLEANRTLIREVLDTMPDGVVAFNTEGTIRRFSAGAVKILGYEPDEVVGKHFTVLTVEHRRESGTANFERYLATGIPHYVGRVTRTSVLAKGGKEVHVELRAVETLAGGDRLIVMFIRDLTETIAYETRLGVLGAELGHVARLSAMGEMAAGMAHELNQPLTAIVNYTGAAQFLFDEGGDVSQARGLVESANKQTLRAGEIIRRMRDFASKGHVEMEAVAVEDMIRDAADLVFVGLRPLDIGLEYDLDLRAATMFGDRIQIQQVLVNLLRNAVLAIQRGPAAQKEIAISTALRANEMIEVSVADTGPGIREDTRATLFVPFMAGNQKGGMGVGLSICRRIVEAHGGEIWAEDREGGGTVFRFTVPI